jgi:hypothetical protein
LSTNDIFGRGYDARQTLVQPGVGRLSREDDRSDLSWPASRCHPCHQHGQEQIRVAHVGCRTLEAKGQSQIGGRTSTKLSVEVVKGIGPEDFHGSTGEWACQRSRTWPRCCRVSAKRFWKSAGRQITCNPAGLLVETPIAHGRRRRCSSAIDFGRLCCELVLVVDRGRRCVHSSRCGVERCAAVPRPGRPLTTEHPQVAGDWLRCSGRRLFN